MILSEISWFKLILKYNIKKHQSEVCLSNTNQFNDGVMHEETSMKRSMTHRSSWIILSILTSTTMKSHATMPTHTAAMESMKCISMEGITMKCVTMESI